MIIKEYISESKSSDWRGCLMLSMPGLLTNAISMWSQRNILADDLAEDGREEYSHCTVLYGFPQSVTFEEVSSYVTNECSISPGSVISVELGIVKRFKADANRPNSDVLVIEVKPGMILNQLHYALKDKFQVVSAYPVYNPHVTIAYVKPGACPELDGNVTFDSFDAMCKDMTYSRGPSENRERKTISYEDFSKTTRA